MSLQGPRSTSLAVLLLCTIGLDLCHTLPWNNDPMERGQGEMAQSRFLSSDEEPGILLPPEDKYNFVGQDDTSTVESDWRTGKSSPFPPSTIVSTGSSYSVRPSTSESSSYVSNTNPMPVVTTGSSYTVKTTGENYYPYNPKDSDKSTVFVKNNCFGPRCPDKSNANTQQYQDDDEWASYHYVLNKGVKQKQKKSYERPARRNDNVEQQGPGFTKKMSLSIPFRVGPSLSKYEMSYPDNNKLSRRVLRTTTPSTYHHSFSTTPGWVKLEPILPDHYDPFNIGSNKTYKLSRPSSSLNSVNPNSQFANRIGVELDPDSFADRWGWSDQNEKGSGSRFPAWLQDANNVKRGSDRDGGENRNWVKLEPIPVAGVTISKWVPKGTSNGDLPSTNWPSRDRVNSNGNGIGHNPNQNSNQQSTKWWDIIDNINRLQQSRPSQQSPYDTPPSYDSPPRGWSPNKNSGPSSSSSSSSSWDRTPQNQWGDVIYPEGPGSATVSWQQDKDMSKHSSSFPLSLATSSSPWQSDLRRPSSSATGSWSADRGSGYQSNNPYGGNRRQGSASYPDRNINEDDPRWVLVSNSRKVTVNSADSNRNPNNNNAYDNIKYRPPFDKFSDFPFYEPPYKNRRGKDYKDMVKVTNITVTRPGRRIGQEEAFSKVNATLANLTPVLNHNNRLRGDNPTNSASSQIIATSSPASSKLPAFLKPYFGDGRKIAPNQPRALMAPQGKRARKGMTINPVYAAVGAGMIPATMAAVLPMVLGRRRRDIQFIMRDPLRNHLNKQSIIASGNYESELHIRTPRSLTHHIQYENQNFNFPSIFNSDPPIILPTTKHVRLRMR